MEATYSKHLEILSWSKQDQELRVSDELVFKMKHTLETVKDLKEFLTVAAKLICQGCSGILLQDRWGWFGLCSPGLAKPGNHCDAQGDKKQW